MEILAPAKINLFLHVVGRRPDGYHELFSLMCCVALYDRLTLTLDGPANELTCNRPDLPCDQHNLALKAALQYNQTLRVETGITPQNVSIRLTKHIPAGAGLGGGSSDAAAVLKGLNQHYGQPFDRCRLQALALSLGADVPFFIDQRPSIAEGVGERLTPFEGLIPLGVLLIYPGFALSTAQVYKSLNFTLTKSKKKLRYFPFKNGNFDASRHLHNDLEAGVGEHFQVIAKIKEDLLNQGAIGASMTGSGSAVFGLFADATAAEKAKAAFDPPAGWQFFATRLLT